MRDLIEELIYRFVIIGLYFLGIIVASIPAMLFVLYDNYWCFIVVFFSTPISAVILDRTYKMERG